MMGKNINSPICPLCHSTFDINDVDLQFPFRCPRCNEYLCLANPRAYHMISMWCALILAGLVSYALGIKGPYLVFGVCLGVIPVLAIIVFWTRYFLPPKLQACANPHSGTLGLGS
jgi:hypothetical protein